MTKSRRVGPQPPTVLQRKGHPLGNLAKADDTPASTRYDAVAHSAGPARRRLLAKRSVLAGSRWGARWVCLAAQSSPTHTAHVAVDESPLALWTPHGHAIRARARMSRWRAGSATTSRGVRSISCITSLAHSLPPLALSTCRWNPLSPPLSPVTPPPVWLWRRSKWRGPPSARPSRPSARRLPRLATRPPTTTRRPAPLASPQRLVRLGMGRRPPPRVVSPAPPCRPTAASGLSLLSPSQASRCSACSTSMTIACAWSPRARPPRAVGRRACSAPRRARGGRPWTQLPTWPLRGGRRGCTGRAASARFPRPGAQWRAMAARLAAPVVPVIPAAPTSGAPPTSTATRRWSVNGQNRWCLRSPARPACGRWQSPPCRRPRWRSPMRGRTLASPCARREWRSSRLRATWRRPLRQSVRAALGDRPCGSSAWRFSTGRFSACPRPWLPLRQAWRCSKSGRSASCPPPPTPCSCPTLSCCRRSRHSSSIARRHWTYSTSRRHWVWRRPAPPSTAWRCLAAAWRLASAFCWRPRSARCRDWRTSSCKPPLFPMSQGSRAARPTWQTSSVAAASTLSPCP